MNEELILTLRGPLQIKQLAVYTSADEESWQMRSGWDSAEPAAETAPLVSPLETRLLTPAPNPEPTALPAQALATSPAACCGLIGCVHFLISSSAIASRIAFILRAASFSAWLIRSVSCKVSWWQCTRPTIPCLMALHPRRCMATPKRVRRGQLSN